jgi:hypothetical protein
MKRVPRVEALYGAGGRMQDPHPHSRAARRNLMEAFIIESFLIELTAQPAVAR